MEKHTVTLSEKERRKLVTIVTKGRNKASFIQRAQLYQCPVVTIGILFALKGGHFWVFCRWLRRDYAALFGGLPDRTTPLRQLRGQQT